MDALILQENKHWRHHHALNVSFRIRLVINILQEHDFPGKKEWYNSIARKVSLTQIAPSFLFCFFFIKTLQGVVDYQKYNK